MNNIWMLTTANLRKSKGQAASFFFLIVLAAALLNLGLLIALHYSENFDKRADANNSADVISVIQNTAGTYIDAYEQELLADERTRELEIRPILLLAGCNSYGSSELTHLYAILNEKQKQEMSKISYIEESEQIPENPIYLPLLFKEGGGYELGDTFLLKVSTIQGMEKEFNYTVAGFFDESMLATINSTTTGLILGEEAYNALSEEFEGSLRGTMFLVKLKDHSQNEPYCNVHLINPSGLGILKDSVFYDVIRQARTLTSTIGSSLVVAFSLIVAGITMVVVKFRIGNHIEEDMQNIGALKAIGYTNRQILVSILLQFLSVGFAGMISGIGASYLLLPFVAQMFAAQTGILWEQGFDLLSAFHKVWILVLLITTVAFLSAKKIRTLPPIVALRSGITTHSFKRNFFPLHKTKGNIIVLLAAKSASQKIRQNALIAFIIMAISFASLFSGVLYYNISLKFDHFLLNTVGELYSVQIECASAQDADEVMADLKNMAQVRKAFYLSMDTAQGPEDFQILSYIVEDYSLYENQDIIYEGRFPKHENEVAVGGLLARKLNKKPGDTFLIIQNGRQIEYLITGLVQGSNFMGHDAALTEEGYRRLEPDFKPSVIAVYLQEEENVEQFIDTLKEQQEGKVAVAADYKKRMESSLGTYQGIVGMLTAVIAAMVGIIVLLTLYLVIKTSVLQKRKELGIQKAIGYTTHQLVIQTAVSFLPVILAGAAAGNILGYLCINPLLSLLFSGIGIMKVNYDIPVFLLLGLGAGITVFGFGISMLVAARIRKISPYALMVE